MFPLVAAAPVPMTSSVMVKGAVPPGATGLAEHPTSIMLVIINDNDNERANGVVATTFHGLSNFIWFPISSSRRQVSSTVYVTACAGCSAKPISS